MYCERIREQSSRGANDDTSISRSGEGAIMTERTENFLRRAFAMSSPMKQPGGIVLRESGDRRQAVVVALDVDEGVVEPAREVCRHRAKLVGLYPIGGVFSHLFHRLQTEHLQDAIVSADAASRIAPHNIM